MKQTRIWAAVLAVVMLVAMLAACSSDTPSTSTSQTSSSTQSQTSTTSTSTADAEPIHMAFIGPLTGDSLQYGVAMRRAVELRVKEFNDAGGYEGRKIVLDVHDDKNDPKETVTIANMILGEDDIWCVMGPFSSGCSMAISPLMQKAEVLQYALSASHPDATSFGKWIFRATRTQDFDTTYYSKFMCEDLGGENIATLFVNSDWGKATNDLIVPKLEEYGATITTSESFLEGQTKDFSPMLTKIKATNPDLIYVMAMYSECATILNQIATLEIDATIVINGSAVKEEVLDIAGENAEGVYSMSAFVLEDPRPVYVAFRQRFKAEYGQDVEVDPITINCYDAMDTVCQAILAVGPDKYKVQEWLANLKDFEGVSGTWSFDEMRNPSKPLYPLVIKDGKFELILD